jgi:hypothetical protein
VLRRLCCQLELECAKSPVSVKSKLWLHSLVPLVAHQIKPNYRKSVVHARCRNAAVQTAGATDDVNSNAGAVLVNQGHETQMATVLLARQCIFVPKPSPSKMQHWRPDRPGSCTKLSAAHRSHEAEVLRSEHRGESLTCPKTPSIPKSDLISVPIDEGENC